MPTLTLEALAARIEAIEQQLAGQRNAAQPRKKDWRRVAGMFTGNDYQKQIDAEGAAIREACPTDEPETSAP